MGDAAGGGVPKMEFSEAVATRYPSMGVGGGLASSLSNSVGAGVAPGTTTPATPATSATGSSVSDLNMMSGRRRILCTIATAMPAMVPIAQLRERPGPRGICPLTPRRTTH